MKEEIICILDKSGSMHAVADDAVNGFNAFLEDQKKLGGDAGLTVVWFDSNATLGYQGPLKDMQPLHAWPQGSFTALLDAIGKTFALVKNRFTVEKPDKVIMAILTDGLENGSHEFTWKLISEMIQHHQEKYGWHVIYLGADQDAWSVGQLLGVKQENAVNYASANTVSGFADYSASVTRARTS